MNRIEEFDPTLGFSGWINHINKFLDDHPDDLSDEEFKEIGCEVSAFISRFSMPESDHYYLMYKACKDGVKKITELERKLVSTYERSTETKWEKN